MADSFFVRRGILLDYDGAPAKVGKVTALTYVNKATPALVL